MTVDEIMARAIDDGCDPGNEKSTSQIVVAIRAELDKAGYVVVPREPTDAMADAVQKAQCDNTDETYVTDLGARQAYRAMLAAFQAEEGK